MTNVYAPLGEHYEYCNKSYNYCNISYKGDKTLKLWRIIPLKRVISYNETLV